MRWSDSGLADAVGGVRARWFFRRATVRGRGIRVRGRPRIALAGTTRVGDGVRVDADVARVEIEVAAGGELTIGDDVHFEPGASVGATEAVTIGSRCRIGRHVQIMDNSFHRLEPERRHERPASEPVVIGADVVIGPMSLVLPGATIGDGSVIGPRSVVVGEIPPGSFASGAPAAPVSNG